MATDAEREAMKAARAKRDALLADPSRQKPEPVQAKVRVTAPAAKKKQN